MPDRAASRPARAEVPASRANVRAQARPGVDPDGRSSAEQNAGSNGAFSRFGRVASRVFGAVLLLVGLALTLGGARLAMLGGSRYYLVAGTGLVLAGILYAMRLAMGAWLFALVFVGTAAWAGWEVGLDFWGLVPRLAGFLVLAVFAALYAPYLGSIASRPMRRGPARAIASLLVVALIAVGVLAFVPHGVVRPSADVERSARAAAVPADRANWQYYGRAAAGTRFAPFDRITRDNVSELEVAWTFRTGDPAVEGSEDQNTPIQIGDTLYVCTPHNQVFALDADTGEPRWKFDPNARSPGGQRCRGVGYYESAVTASGHCARRIVLTTIDARLIALDAVDGQPCAQFGERGTVDLKTGMGENEPGLYFQTSQPTVMRDRIVVGGWVFDNREIGEPSGVVRAFDAETGKLAWAWDLGDPAIIGLPRKGRSYPRGTPNFWSTAAFDDKLGLIYLPLGNPAPDYRGASRSEADEVYSSSIIALEIDSGRERWKFQTVHHDLWDYDLGAQPALVDLPDGRGGTLFALVQASKTGQIYLLDRRNGKPLAEVRETSVPQGGQPGDRTSATQPLSVGMPSIGTAPLSEARMWGATFFDQLWCRIEFRKLRYEGAFTPPTTAPTLIYPGYYGGMNWGGVSIDESNGYLIVNDIRMPQSVQLVSRERAERAGSATTHDGSAYGVARAGFFSPLQVPCHQPPYGTLTAVDLLSRRIVWQVPLGTVRDSGPFGRKSRLPIPLGMPTLGGPITTASGLVFYAGTQDYYLRALDVDTGKELWKGRLPVGAQATPITYVSPNSGRQYVVVSAGGARLRADRGDYVIAYALRKR